MRLRRVLVSFLVSCSSIAIHDKKYSPPTVTGIIQVFYTLDKNGFLFSSVTTFPYKFLNDMKLTWARFCYNSQIKIVFISQA